MKTQYRCETGSSAPDQIGTLVITLSQRVRLLESDIEAEEERTRCTDRRDASYSILARTLVARRDNLSATIADVALGGLSRSRGGTTVEPRPCMIMNDCCLARIAITRVGSRPLPSLL